jgi:hypothetical protein
MKADAFLYQVLDLVAKAEMYDEVFWHATGGFKAPTILVNCSDFFAWACADAQPITQENIDHLRAAIDECEAVPEFEGVGWIGLLFCAKARGMRPQGCAYPKHHAVAALFDACGPKREYEYKSECKR